MAKWICKVCGYAHYGDEAPERCPDCGASKSEFYQKEEGRGCVLSVIFAIMALTAVIMTLCSCHASKNVDNSTVKSMNVNKFLGKWYEIARFDHKFERGMRNCTATYIMTDDGKIKVVNKGWKENEWKTSEGRVKLTEEPGVLRVSFFWPFYSDYRIMMLAPDYSYALIGGSSDKYLWILSRSPHIKNNVRNDIIGEAKRRGYMTENLIWVAQK